MNTELATVCASEGEYIWVQKINSTTCSGCQSAGSCGSAVLHKYFGNKYRRLRLHNHIDARVGDTLELSINPDILLKMSVATYVPPLILIIVGAALGQWLAPAAKADIYSIAGAVLGLLLGALWLQALALAWAQASNKLLSARKVNF